MHACTLTNLLEFNPLTLHLPSTAPHTPRLHATTCCTYSAVQAYLTPVDLLSTGQGRAQPCIWANNKQTLLGQGTAHTVVDLNPDVTSDDPAKSLALFVVKANLKVTC